MTPTFPPSPAQGETAGVSELPIKLREAADRILNHCFNKSGDSALVSIPADRSRDVDLLLFEAADQLEVARQQLAELHQSIADERIVFWEKDADQRKAIENREARLRAAEQQLAEMRVRVDNLYRTIDSKQAKIDALMMEFCPGEMSAEQRAEWARNQVAGDPFATSQPDCDDGDICLCVEDLGPAMSCPQHGTVTVEIKHKSVEALRANCSHASRTDGICDLCEDNVASHDPVRSAGETHPVPERGKCGGTRVIGNGGSMNYGEFVTLPCPGCVDCAQPERQGADNWDCRQCGGDGGDSERVCPGCGGCGLAPIERKRPSPPQDDIVAGLREILAGKNIAINPSIIERAIAALGEKGAK